MVTYEQWVEDATDQGEEYLVAAIKRWLLTPHQHTILVEHNLSIEDLLNGRWPCGHMSFYVNNFFKPWNETLGWKEFVEA